MALKHPLTEGAPDRIGAGRWRLMFKSTCFANEHGGACLPVHTLRQRKKGSNRNDKTEIRTHASFETGYTARDKWIAVTHSSRTGYHPVPAPWTTRPSCLLHCSFQLYSTSQSGCGRIAMLCIPPLSLFSVMYRSPTGRSYTPMSKDKTVTLRDSIAGVTKRRHGYEVAGSSREGAHGHMPSLPDYVGWSAQACLHRVARTYW